MLAGSGKPLGSAFETGPYGVAEVTATLHEGGVGTGDVVVAIDGLALGCAEVSLGNDCSFIFGSGNGPVEKSIFLLGEEAQDVLGVLVTNSAP